MLVVPGAVVMVVSLAGFTQIVEHLADWQLLGLHVLMMAALALIFTPVFTLRPLGACPRTSTPTAAPSSARCSRSPRPSAPRSSSA